MDVTCERCGTEYEFDETLVSGRGTTVKCTNCGHLFKVFRPDAESGVARTWNVRGADGVVRKLSSLKELQRLITAGTLTEHDEISRGNEPYKRLGDIAELSTFFAAATASVADTDADLANRQRKATTPGMAVAPVPDRQPVSKAPQASGRTPEPPRAPPPARPKDTLVGVGGAAKPQSQPPPPQRPSAPRPPAPESTPPISPSPRVPAEAASPRRAVPPASSTPTAPATPPPSPPSSRPAAPRPSDRPLYIEDDEPVVPARGRSRSGLWVGLVVLVAAGVGIALAWPTLAPMLGLAEPPAEENPAAAHLAPGDASLAEDTIGGYEQALHHYTLALAFDDHDVEALTRISRAHALWAQALAFDAADLEAAGAEDPARFGEANALRREQQRHAETALARAEDAVRYGSTSAAAEAALSDALRLTGDLPRARSRLNRALTFESDADAETLRVQALVTIAEAEGNLAAGRDLAEQAVAEDPSLVRARILYARALLAAGDRAAATSQLEAILRREERHPDAVALRDRIAAAAADPTVDAGVAAPPVDPTAPPTEPPPTEPTPTEPTPTQPTPTEPTPTGRRGGSEEPSGERAPAGRDYSWYVRRGDELFERGSLGPAQEHYEAARAERPGGSEALTGLGNVLLQQGDANGAAARFRTAAGQGYGEAYVGLGRAYRRLGRNDDAIAAFERYLQRMPTGTHASLARRQIEELRAAGGGGGGGGGGGSEPTPTPTPTEPLPPPRDMQDPPPEDVPAIDSEP